VFCGTFPQLDQAYTLPKRSTLHLIPTVFQYV
jgi:hypothetical protein